MQLGVKLRSRLGALLLLLRLLLQSDAGLLLLGGGREVKERVGLVLACESDGREGWVGGGGVERRAGGRESEARPIRSALHWEKGRTQTCASGGYC